MSAFLNFFVALWRLMNAWQSLKLCSLLELTFDVLLSGFVLDLISVHLWCL